MSNDNKKYTGVFSDFSAGDFAGPKNITSDMWTAISVAPVSNDNSNLRYNSRENDTGFISSQHHNTNDVKRTCNSAQQGNNHSGQVRHSDKRKAPENKTAQHSRSSNKNNKSASQSNGGQLSAQRSVKQGQQTKRPANQRPMKSNHSNDSRQRYHVQNDAKRPSSTQRTPMGKDKRKASAEHARQPVSQREIQMQRQNKKNVQSSNDRYEERRNSGASHNEILKENSAKKKKRRKIRNIVSVIVVALFVACFILVYSYSKGAPVQKVIIQGDSIYTDKQVIYVSGIRTGDNMLGIRKKQVSELIETKLPYILDAEIDFTLPDTVTITVTGTMDKILINNTSDYICLDDNNKIVSLKKKKLSPGYYRVDGFDTEEVTQGTFYEPIESNKKRLEIAKEIVACFEENSMEKAAIITVSDLNDVQVIYDARIRIYLGKCEDLQSQLALAIQTIKHSAADKQKGYIDMRYSNTAYFSEGSMDA